ncbi:MAG: prepilin peptidase [Lachnospiraceae bacterium]|nr:prepilin peptidase [Lachnospiraceae bacterium]
MTTPTILLGVVIFLYGIVIGSFCNVCIYRIPAKENIVKIRSHCMGCGYQLKWYDLIPLVSFTALGGKCRKCKQKLSVQYPLIEALNGVLYVVVFYVNGVNVDSLLYCLLTSALLVLSIIDFRTYEIPFGINLFILALGLIHLVLHLDDWLDWGIGFLAVSAFLYILYLLSRGRAIGGGDIKLMAVCGLLLGWQKILLGFVLGCMLGSVIHLTRMKVSKADHVLAMGPYLAAGVWIALLWGENLISWYIKLCS